ncbi:hypothetical protein [Thiolapillus brandeum]|uniref:hypothetical protein n=1 Tax=Thiolapillus brandeum TaxID=1076588 RepID=UPI00118504F4|nr:hypothetical protein [Thiolapillus brandeum]
MAEPDLLGRRVNITMLSVGGVKMVYAVLGYKMVTGRQSNHFENVARKTAGGLMLGAGSYLIIKT